MSPLRERKRRSRDFDRPKAKSPLKVTDTLSPSALDSPKSNGNSITNGKPSTRFGEKAAIAPPPLIVDPLATESSPKPIKIPAAPKHRPSFAPAATVEIVDEKPKTQKPKDILSRIKIQPTLKPGIKASFAPASSGFGPQDGNIFEDELDKTTLAITGLASSKALAVITDSKSVTLVKDGQKVGSSSNSTFIKKKSKKVTGPKAKGPQVNQFLFFISTNYVIFLAQHGSSFGSGIYRWRDV